MSSKKKVPIEVKIFKPGDKVKVILNLEELDWEREDWTRAMFEANPKLKYDGILTVRDSDCRGDEPSITIKEDRICYSMHPNHFELVEND